MYADGLRFFGALNDELRPRDVEGPWALYRVSCEPHEAPDGFFRVDGGSANPKTGRFLGRNNPKARRDVFFVPEERFRLLTRFPSVETLAIGEPVQGSLI